MVSMAKRPKCQTIRARFLKTIEMMSSRKIPDIVLEGISTKKARIEEWII